MTRLLFDPAYLTTEILTFPLLLVASVVIISLWPIGPLLMQTTIVADDNSPFKEYSQVSYLELIGAWFYSQYYILRNSWNFVLSSTILFYDLTVIFTLFWVWIMQAMLYTFGYSVQGMLWT